jgi:hypothetical protein
LQSQHGRCRRIFTKGNFFGFSFLEESSAHGEKRKANRSFKSWPFS